MPRLAASLLTWSGCCLLGLLLSRPALGQVYYAPPLEPVVSYSTPVVVMPVAVPVMYDPGYGYGSPSYGYAMPPQYPPWRPCGPCESFGSNWLFRQGYHGADFRPSCAAHDDCLQSGMFSRCECDRQFLASMEAACANSAYPWLCRMKAREYYVGVRLFGWMY